LFIIYPADIIIPVSAIPRASFKKQLKLFLKWYQEINQKDSGTPVSFQKHCVNTHREKYFFPGA
jgi:hypothetical protein